MVAMASTKAYGLAVPVTTAWFPLPGRKDPVAVGAGAR